jgi:electron transport complex protein RnfD
MSETANTPTVQLPDASQLMVSNSPHIRDNQSIPKIMFAVILALVPSILAGIWFFGLPALKVLLLTTLSCVLLEEGWNRLHKKPSTWRDGSAILTGLLLGLNLNAGVPWWICVLGGLLAIILAKQLFGGLGFNPFNPALVARVGLLIGFPAIMTTWNVPQAGKLLPDALTAATPLGEGATPAALTSLFTGNIGGCIGETSVIALLLGGLFLLWKKLIRWEIPVAFIGTVFLITAVPYILNHHGINILRGDALPHSPVYHVLSGGLLLGAFFMATDMVTTPMTRKGMLIFGLGCGIMTSMIRLWGAYPEGVSFSILFMNALTPLIDRATISKPFGFVAPQKGEA